MDNLERPHVSLLDIAGPDLVQHYRSTLETSFDLAQYRADLTSDQANFALGMVLATKHILDPIIRDARMPNSPIVQVTGGEDGNPHRAIDNAGGYLMDLALENHAPWLGIGKLFVEEREQWEPIGKPVDTDRLHLDRPAPYDIIQDPCDGTSHTADGNLFVATAVTILDHNHEFVASAMASLVTKAVFVVDKTTPHLYNYTPEFHYLQEIPIPEIGIENRPSPWIATLDKRIPELIEAGILNPKDKITMRTFGGHAAIALVLGQVDLLIDPRKGQPLYEAMHWGWSLAQAGYWVRDERGKRINFPKLVGESQLIKDMPRVPIIIARNEAIGQAFLTSHLPLAV